MSFLGRLARFVAPLPATATHSVRVSLPPVFVEDIPCPLIPQASVCRIPDGVIDQNNGISPDLLFAVSGIDFSSLFVSLRAATTTSPPGFCGLGDVWVSGNLFERLVRAGIVGSNYIEHALKRGPV